MLDFNVSLSVNNAMDIVNNHLTVGFFGASAVDTIYMQNAGKTAVVAVYDKYFMRNNSRASLTVTIDDFSGATHVQCIGSGGGEGLIFKFDWGAGDSFSANVENALKEYII